MSLGLLSTATRLHFSARLGGGGAHPSYALLTFAGEPTTKLCLLVTPKVSASLCFETWILHRSVLTPQDAASESEFRIRVNH